jgi:RNA:NAD 2'-phosphotransferase (TPT1/KptA family)
VTYEKTQTTIIQEKSTLVWDVAGMEEATMNPARRETEVATREECVAARGAQRIEGNSQVLLQVTCRSIFNKGLDFWNLVDTYNPDVVIGTESWLRE